VKLETARAIGNFQTDMRGLEAYVADRSLDILKMMETEKDIDAIRQYQGMLMELRRLLTIRDLAQKVILNGREAQTSNNKSR
jgi:hypothetical protein